MKKLFCNSLFILLFTGICSSLSGQLEESFVYSRNNTKLVPKGIIPSNSDNGFIIAGSRDFDEFIMKVDASFDPIWIRKLFPTDLTGSFLSEPVMSISDSSYVLFGSYQHNNTGYQNLSVSEISETGQVLSKRLIDFGESVIPIKHIENGVDGNIVLMNNSSNFLVGLDQNGYPTWTKKYESSDGDILIFENIFRAQDNTLIAVGRLEEFVFISKIDLQGEVLWSKSIEVEQSFQGLSAFDILESEGKINILFDGIYEIFLLTLDQNGDFMTGLSWLMNYDNSNGYNKHGFIHSEGKDNIVYSGSSIVRIDLDEALGQKLTNSIGIKGYLKTESAFHLLTMKTISSSQDESIMGVFKGTEPTAMFENNDLCMNLETFDYSVLPEMEMNPFDIISSNASYVLSDSVSIINAFVVDMDNECLNLSDNVEGEKIQEIDIYPNPTSKSFVINSEEKMQEITVFNAFGQVVSRNQGINSSEIQFDTSSWSAGMYYVQLSINDQIISKRVIVEK